jgi:RHS repeat-associated protein
VWEGFPTARQNGRTHRSAPTSATLATGVVYRIGIRQQAGTGANGVLEAFVATGDAAFGAAFTSSSAQTFTTSASEVRVGATNTVALNAVFDSLLIDTASMPVPSSLPATRTIAYTYDGLQRLTAAVETGATTNNYSYGYDAAGNRTSSTINGVTTTRSYNAANQVSGWTYDAAGNLTSDGSNFYSYDALGRVTLSTVGGLSRTNAYNGDGMLVAQTSNSITTRYTQDLANPLSQILSDGSNTYVYGLERLYGVAGSARTWYTTDALGSVRATLNDAGIVGGSATYDPYGGLQGSAISSFGYTGELQQGSNVYLRARWYHPATGTFLGRDPWMGDPQRPASLLPYLYTANNPINRTDPSGMDWLDDLQRGAHWVNDRVGVDAAQESATFFQQVGSNLRNNPGLLRSVLCDSALLDDLQFGLDAGGMIPILGVPIDLANAGISAWRGNYADAALRAAFALPGVGDYAGGVHLVGMAGRRVLIPELPQSLKSTLPAVGGIYISDYGAIIDDAIYNAMKAIPLSGYYDVIVHASERGTADLFGKTVTANELAAFIHQQADYAKGTPIRLLACHAGSCLTGKSLAGELAKEMQVPVLGATSFVSVSDDGIVDLVLDAGWDNYDKYYAVLDPNGEWILFRP